MCEMTLIWQDSRADEAGPDCPDVLRHRLLGMDVPPVPPGYPLQPGPAVRVNSAGLGPDLLLRPDLLRVHGGARLPGA